MRTKMKYVAVIVAGVLSMTGSLWAASVQDAAEDAAYQAVRRMTVEKPGVKRIAFVGLFNDNNNLLSAFRGGLNAAPGIFEFYTRDEQEFNLLVSEIEFGERREDVMTADTIQKFGKISGVDALLYGDVLDVSQAGGQTSVKISWYLSDVETGQQLSFGTVVGTSKDIVPPQQLNKNAVEAVTALAEKLKSELATKTELKTCDVVVMPMAGEQSGAVSRILASKLSSMTDGVRFFDMPGDPVQRRMYQRLAMEVGEGITEENRDRVVKQLAQVVTNQPSRTLAVLTGTVEKLVSDKYDSEITISFSIKDIAGGKTLAGNTLTAAYKVPIKDRIEDQIVDEGVEKITVKNILLIIGGIFVAIVLLFIISKMFRVK